MGRTGLPDAGPVGGPNGFHPPTGPAMGQGLRPGMGAVNGGLPGGPHVMGGPGAPAGDLDSLLTHKSARDRAKTEKCASLHASSPLPSLFFLCSACKAGQDARQVAKVLAMTERFALNPAPTKPRLGRRLSSSLTAQGRGAGDAEHSAQTINPKPRAVRGRRGEELLELIGKRTAKELAVVEQFRTEGGPAVREYCPHLTKLDCCRHVAAPACASPSQCRNQRRCSCWYVL